VDRRQVLEAAAHSLDSTVAAELENDWLGGSTDA
jgi:hypothetical protein